MDAHPHGPGNVTRNKHLKNIHFIPCPVTALMTAFKAFTIYNPRQYKKNMLTV